MSSRWLTCPQCSYTFHLEPDAPKVCPECGYAGGPVQRTIGLDDESDPTALDNPRYPPRRPSSQIARPPRYYEQGLPRPELPPPGARRQRRPPPAPVAPPRKRPGPAVMVFTVLTMLVCGIIVVVALAAKNSPGSQSSGPSGSVAPTPKPTTSIHYPPTTEADLHGLAAKGDASAIHEFHSESVGLTGVCPQPKREVTVSPSITGQQLAEDLLAYFYGNQLDSPCGSLVLAYHLQSEAGDAYTAGRIAVDTQNNDPNATNAERAMTLDIGDALSGQEYMITY